MKVLVDSGPLTSGHSVRGVGFNTRGLLYGLQSQNREGISIETGGVFNADLSKYNVVHFTAFHPFFLSLPFFKPKNTKFILTIHDLMQLIYPSVYKPGIKGKIKFWINKFLIKMHVDAIITISETSKKDICRFLKISPEIVHVIPLAPAQRQVDKDVTKETVSKKFKLPNRFVLYVGDINYVKNIKTLVDACRDINAPLVISGKQALEVDSLDLNHPELRHLKDINWKGVYRLGFASDSELVRIYELATLYVQPSFYEGFGMPVLEAFLLKCPVVASKTQALVEIAEGGALFFDPNSKEDLKEKIKTVLSDDNLRKQLINSGEKIVKNYSWEKLGFETIKVYEKV